MIDFLIKSIKKLTSWSFEAVSLANASGDVKMSDHGVPYPSSSSSSSGSSISSSSSSGSNSGSRSLIGRDLRPLGYNFVFYMCLIRF